MWLCAIITETTVKHCVQHFWEPNQTTLWFLRYSGNRKPYYWRSLGNSRFNPNNFGFRDVSFWKKVNQFGRRDFFTVFFQTKMHFYQKKKNARNLSSRPLDTYTHAFETVHVLPGRGTLSLPEMRFSHHFGYILGTKTENWTSSEPSLIFANATFGMPMC